MRIATLLLCLGCAAAAAGKSPLPGLPLTPCELSSPDGTALVKAECGRLSVPEDPARPAGRHIALAVAVVRAVRTDKRPDPLFVLAGGPGEAASTFYASVATAFAAVNRDRDIVLVDQRGTGGSNALKCNGQIVDGAPSVAQLDSSISRCLKRLRTHAQVRFYTTDLAVQDLDRVRAALGYTRINLYGSSYGTVVAQEYVRRFPHRVRSVILDGVVPPQVAIGAMSALSAQRAVSHLFADCAAQSDCRAHFGDPQQSYTRLHAALAAHPVTVNLPDPTSGRPRTLVFGDYQLAQVLRLASYTPAIAALLPLDLHEAAQGNYRPLAGEYLFIDQVYGNAVAAGMNYTVVCSEDVPFYHVTAAQRAQMSQTFLGTRPLDELGRICRLWPHGPVAADFHAPLKSDVPALLLSGGDDPITPPQFATEAASGFRHSLSLVIPRFGHGQLMDPCMDEVIAQFLRRAAVTGLDVSCLANLRPMPFFLTPGGPAP